MELDPHSSEFCLQLSGQVAHSSAGIRLEQATPASQSYLVTAGLGCVSFSWFLTWQSLFSAGPKPGSHLVINPLHLFVLEDGNFVPGQV